MSTDTNTAARQAIELMAQYRDGAQFNGRAFHAEMEARCLETYHRPLSLSERQTLAAMVAAYMARHV